MNTSKILSNETVIRIISLLIAIILWMYVVSVDNPQIDTTIRNIPIQVVNTANVENNGLEIISMSDEKIDVKISGRMSDVSDVTSSDIIVQLDVSNIYSANNYYVKPDVKVNAGGITVVGLSTESINVYVDYISRVEKDILISTTGEPKKGYSVSELSSASKKVIVSGPQSIINRIDTVKAVIDVSGTSEELNKVAELKMYSSVGEEISSDKVKLSVTDISVSVKFEYTKSLQIVAEINETEDIVTDAYNLVLSQQEIEVTGTEDILKDISEIKAVISSVPFNDENLLLSHEWEAILEVPEGVIVKGDLNTITVKIEKK